MNKHHVGTAMFFSFLVIPFVVLFALIVYVIGWWLTILSFGGVGLLYLYLYTAVKWMIEE